MFDSWPPWAILIGYGLLVWWLLPTRVSPVQFYGGQNKGGVAPGLWLLVASSAISWLFAKSVANAASLGQAFGIWGGIGYACYYLSFAVAAAGIYFIRTRGGYSSRSPTFSRLATAATCAKLFLLTPSAFASSTRCGPTPRSPASTSVKRAAVVTGPPPPRS